MLTVFPSVMFAAEPASQGNALMQFLPFILMFVLLYFMMIRPHRRQQREHQMKLAALRSGDEVVAAGGIHGLVTHVSDRVVTLKIADNVKIKVEKASVAAILKKFEDPEPDEPPAPAGEAAS